MPKRRVTGLTDWISRFSAIPIARQQIDALWEEIDPILTLENASIIISAIDSNANQHNIVNTSGQIKTDSAADIATIETYQDHVRDGVLTGLPLAWDAAGDHVAVNTGPLRPAWIPITPVTVTADGAGLPPPTEIVALSAGDMIDVMLFFGVDTVSGANQYLMNFREATAAPAALATPWVDIEVPSAARGHHPEQPYGFRMMTATDGVNFGVADGANADWPNAAKVIFTGFYRYI